MHEPDVVPVEISWMAEGPGKVAPIGPVGTERPPGADATHSKSMHVPSEPASSSLWPWCILRAPVAFAAAVNPDFTLFLGLLLSGIMPISVSLTPPC